VFRHTTKIIFLKDEILGGWVGQDNFVQKAKFKKIDNYEWPLTLRRNIAESIEVKDLGIFIGNDTSGV
jgi:hypothetical protein